MEQKDEAEAGTALRPPRLGVSVLVSALDSPERIRANAVRAVLEMPGDALQVL